MNKPYILRSICRHFAVVAFLLCAVVPAMASSQAPVVSIEAKDVSVKELFRRIEAESSYTFAYTDVDIDTGKIVSVKAENRTIESIVAEILPDVKAEIHGSIVVLVSPKSKAAGRLAADAPRKFYGRVVDEQGDPIVGATVMVEGTTIGTATDLSGEYTLTVKEPSPVLVFSLLSFNEVKVAPTPGQTMVNVTMTAEAINVGDVVVVGYGVQNKRDVTTSIASIKAEDFAGLATSDFRDAMAAKMPGVQVLALGGQPDGNVSIRIRGIQSATSGNDPLYVIDGIPTDARGFANLESSEIESLEVLKDASAAAIYGSRGSCGVILITTKRGSSERPVVSYDGQFSVSQVSKRYDMLDAYEFATIMKEARDGAYLHTKPSGSMEDDYAQRPNEYERVNPIILAYLQDETGSLTNTDWQDAIFRNAIAHKHNLSVSGRSQNLSYYIGANYLYREGTIIGSDFERYGIRANLDGKRNRLKYGISFAPSYSKTNYVASDAQYNGDGVIASALQAAPIFPVYNEDGSYNWDMNGLLRGSGSEPWDMQYNEHLNPVALALEVDDVREKINMLGNTYVGYEFIKGLEYKFTAGGDYYNYTKSYYRPSYIPLRGKNYYTKASDPTATRQDQSYFHWTISNQLSFNRTFGDHSVNAVAAYDAEKQTIKTTQITAVGTAGDDKIRTTRGKTIDPSESYDNKYAYTFASWLVRAQYSYKGRYMVSASVRGDGSSRFAPNTRWGYFPAASVGWRMSDERWMSNAKSWMDDLKIRASVGQTGNAQIGNSKYLALYNMTADVDLGNGLITQVYPNQIANNDLGWEKNTQYNIGFDLSLWQGLLGLNADYYYSKTTNMLFDVPVSSVSGLTSSDMNIGSMQNTGVELNLTSRRSFGDFSYAFAANWSLNRNKVLSLGDENADIIKGGSSEKSGTYYLTRVGLPVGCYYLLVYDGAFQNQKELDSYPHFSDAQVGDARFIDANGNGIIEVDDDRVVVGNYMPDFYYGFSLNLGYKGFDLSANFQGVYGNEILNLERRYLVNMEASSNMTRETLQRYPYGNLNRATRKSSGNSNNTSTFHIEDGSYLRLQTLSLGYTLPDRLVRRAGISKLRIYLQGSNLFTWTNYTGYNPEVNKRASDALTPGEDYCSYPLSRTYTVGINFNL